MFLKRKRLADKGEDDRQRILAYKKTFGTPEGKEVLFDLLNRYHILNSHGGDPLKEGQRTVALHILSQCHVDLAQFDKLLRGELNG